MKHEIRTLGTYPYRQFETVLAEHLNMGWSILSSGYTGEGWWAILHRMIDG